MNYKNKNHVNDEFAHIIPIPSSSHITINHAVMIAGFPSPGMIGSIVSEQLIEQIGMHQIAYVHSKYILPGVLWAGAKLRHLLEFMVTKMVRFVCSHAMCPSHPVELIL